MAKCIIVLTDVPDMSHVHIEAEFNPPMKPEEGITPAQKTCMDMLQAAFKDQEPEPQNAEDAN